MFSVSPAEKSSDALELIADPVASAASAGLHYVVDVKPGIRRQRMRPNVFRYLNSEGTPVRDPDTLARIRGLAIPPAWSDVWISPDPRGHLQATGRDARGRKQYRYHPEWRTFRDGTKYDKMLEFGAALPAIRATTERHLALEGLPREKVLATIVHLLEGTLIRVGNEEYAKQNRSFGLTTLRSRHVDIDGSTLRFHFRGKSGKDHEVGIRDRRLARIVQRIQELPGQELFQYVDDDGAARSVTSADVNQYLREVSGSDFTAKDFRTWAGTVLTALSLAGKPAPRSATQRKRMLADTVKSVSERLGNTPTVCRKCYVHPAVIDGYVEGSLAAAMQRPRQTPADVPHLLPEEVLVLTYLSGRATLAATPRPRRAKSNDHARRSEGASARVAGSPRGSARPRRATPRRAKVRTNSDVSVAAQP